MSPDLDYVGLLPEISIAVVFVLVLVADLVLSDDRKRWLTVLSVAGTSVSLGLVIALAVSGHYSSMVADTYVVDGFALAVKGFCLAVGLVVFLMGSPRAWKGEYFVLLLASLLGMVMLPSSRDLITFFVAFELLAIPGYLLVGWRKLGQYGHEAALKYYLLGVIATAVMLYGLSLLFGIAGATRFSDVSEALRVSDLNALASMAVLFVLIGMGFKVAAVPFHFWAPDVYQGAPLPVAAFLAVASKAAGLFAIVLLIATLFPSADVIWAPFLWVLAAVTMTVGNLVALRQSDIVRLLAWSSISQAGFILVPLALVGRYGGTLEMGVAAVVDYMVFYGIGAVGAFAVVIGVVAHTKSTALRSFRGLFSRNPVAAVALAVAMLSLAGIPPLGGWFAKFVVFNAAVEANSVAAYSLAFVAAINTAISLVYYAVVTRQLWLPADEAAPAVADVHPDGAVDNGLALAPARDGNRDIFPDTPGARLLVVGMPIFVLLTGILPGLVTSIGSGSSLGM